MNYNTRTFSLDALATTDAVRELYDLEVQVAGSSACNRYSDAGWLGLPNTRDLDRAAFVAGIADQGDRQTTDRVIAARREADQLQVPVAHSIRPVLKHRRSTGQRYDLERVLDGDPLPWSRYERGPRAKGGSRIVTLYLPLGGSAALSASEIAWGPIASLVIADLLEGSGYRVEIWACNTSECGNNQNSVRCQVKQADQPLDLAGLARVAHPAVTRMIFFPMLATSFGMEKVGHNYGRSVETNPTAFGDPDAIVVGHTYNAAQCRSEISRVVKLFE